MLEHNCIVGLSYKMRKVWICSTNTEILFLVNEVEDNAYFFLKHLYSNCFREKFQFLIPNLSKKKQIRKKHFIRILVGPGDYLSDS
jgi:hypothetical protein